jgi:hypothetical protein
MGDFFYTGKFVKTVKSHEQRANHRSAKVYRAL